MWHMTRSAERCMSSAVLKFSLGAFIFGALISSTMADDFPLTGPTVSGSTARLHRGRAAAPERAPLAVKTAVRAAKQGGSKSYRYWCGDRSLPDNRHRLSGTNFLSLGGWGLLYAPMRSSQVC